MPGIEEITPELFAERFGNGTSVYDRVGFALLNSSKVNRVYFLSTGEGKHLYGIILGDRGDCLASPFSAPFGGLIPASTCHINPERTTGVLAEIKAYGRELGKKVRITLPPRFYAPDLVAEQANALFRLGQLRVMDLNYHFDVKNFEGYPGCLNSHEARNYRRARMRDYTCVHAMVAEDVGLFERAYAIVRRNREEKGFPLRMTASDMLATAPLASTMSVVLSLDGSDMASAIIHAGVAPGIWQVVYWADVREYSTLRPMNVLAAEVYRLAAEYGIKIVDIGPSSADSEPNYGLCGFKLSTGCEESIKMTFEI